MWSSPKQSIQGVALKTSAVEPWLGTWQVIWRLEMRRHNPRLLLSDAEAGGLNTFTVQNLLVKRWRRPMALLGHRRPQQSLAAHLVPLWVTTARHIRDTAISINAAALNFCRGFCPTNSSLGYHLRMKKIVNGGGYMDLRSAGHGKRVKGLGSFRKIKECKVRPRGLPQNFGLNAPNASLAPTSLL